MEREWEGGSNSSTDSLFLVVRENCLRYHFSKRSIELDTPLTPFDRPTWRPWGRAAAMAVLSHQPEGMTPRVSLPLMGFLLCHPWLGYMGIINHGPRPVN